MTATAAPPTRDQALAALTAPGQPHELIVVAGPRGPIRAFANAPKTLGQLYRDGRSDKPFLVYGEERWTFEEVWRQAAALAQALTDDYGVRPGDRVAISMRNFPEWMIAFNAATAIGAITVAMNAMWQPHEMAYGLADSGAKVLVCDPERLTRLKAFEGGPPADVAVILARADTAPASLPPVGRVDSAHSGERGGAQAEAAQFPGGFALWDEVLARRPAADELPDQAAAVGSDDDALMLYTSGSTGAPKGVVSSHRAVLSALLSWELDLNAAWATGLLPRPPGQNTPEGPPQGAALLAIPLFHVTGLHTIYLSSYRLQRRVVSMWKWDPSEAAALIERERVTSFVAPPAVTGDLVVQARAGGHDLSSLVQVGGGGAARAPEQVRAIAAAFANARPGTGWGMTETNAIGVGIAAGDYLAHPESSGRVSAVMDIRVVDEAGAVLGAGQRGELQVRGAAMFRTYWNRPEADAESFDGDWFRSGDVARIDADGFCYIVDRIKDLVIRGGENVGCGAVEAALLEHPAVVEACVYGVPDARLGEEVAATVYAPDADDVTAGELQGFLEARLSRFEIPRYIRFADAPLVRGDTGKILKRVIRAEHAAQF